jgi:N-acetyl-anhydromuramyl-L-alanine amidase AmpD
MLFSTPPLVIIDQLADERHRADSRLGFDFIFFHHTGGRDSRAWLSKTSSPPVSCHRLISRNGTIYKIVPDHLVAFTQGPADIGPIPENGENANQRGLSIEFENLGNGQDWPEAQLRSGAAQVVEWWGAYGWLPILYHKQVQANKNDPYGFPRDRFDRLVLEQLRALLM